VALKCGDVVDHISFGRGVICDRWRGGEICEVRFADEARSVHRCRLSLIESAPAINPYAAKIPAAPQDEYELLRTDIEKHGLLHPIVLDSAGRILDGASRHRACVSLGIIPRTVSFESIKGAAPGLTEVAYVFSVNLARRNLSQSQKAALILELLPAVRKETEARRRAAQAKGRETRWGQQSNGAVSSEPRKWSRGPTTNAILAKRAGVGAVTMSQVVAVNDHRPDLLPQLANGSLSAASAIKLVRKNRVAAKAANGNGDAPSLEKKTILCQWRKTWEAFLKLYPPSYRKEVQRIVLAHLTAR